MKLDGIWHMEQKRYVSRDDLTLYYRMMAHHVEKRTIYSLSVELFMQGEREECFLWDVAADREMAERIFVLFTEGLVTPVTAGDIMEELLSDAAFLYGQ